MRSIARVGAWSLAGALAIANAVLAITHIDITALKAIVAPEGVQPAGRVRVEPTAAGIHLNDLSEVLARPAFWSSRRPREIQPETALPSPAPTSQRAKPDEFKLTGVMRHNSRKRALIAWHERPDGVWLEEGAVYAGWRIASIDDLGVRLEADGDTHRLHLREP